MTPQTYDSVLQLTAPLLQLAACRGVMRDSIATPTFTVRYSRTMFVFGTSLTFISDQEAHAILCVILDPIIGSLTVGAFLTPDTGC